MTYQSIPNKAREAEMNTIVANPANAGVVIISMDSGILGYGSDFSAALSMVRDSFEIEEDEIEMFPSNAHLEGHKVAAFNATQALIDACDDSDLDQVKYETARGRAFAPGEREE